MEMVERVAKAIFESDHTDRLKALGDEPWLKWEELARGMRRHFEYAARAAIEAMREPTEEMIKMGLYDEKGFNRLGVCTGDLTNAYTRMISAALKE